MGGPMSIPLTLMATTTTSSSIAHPRPSMVATPTSPRNRNHAQYLISVNSLGS